MRGQAAMMRPRTLTPHTPNTQEVYETIMRHLHLSIAHQIWFDDLSHFVNESKFTGMFTQPIQTDIEEIIERIPTQYIDQEFHSIVEFRKHLFWYVTGLSGNKEFKQYVVAIKTYRELVEKIEGFFTSLQL